MTPLDEAKAKIAPQLDAFIEACGRMPRHYGFRRDHARERVKKRFALSWHHMTLLEGHYVAEIKAWPNKPAARVAASSNALPPGDRE
jgi:hypothetical protein